MKEIVIMMINKFGYFGIILLIAIENIFPPIPSEVILTFGGFATTISTLTIFGTIIASTVGSLIGAIILYYIGRALDREKIDRLADSKTGKILHIKKENIQKSFNWFDSKGQYTVFFGRFIPIIRSLVSIPAGMAKMPIFPFLLLTTIGSLIWNTVLIILGKIAGTAWDKMAININQYSKIISFIIIAVAILGIIIYYLKKIKKIKIIAFKTK